MVANPNFVVTPLILTDHITNAQLYQDFLSMLSFS